MRSRFVQVEMPKQTIVPDMALRANRVVTEPGAIVVRVFEWTGINRKIARCTRSFEQGSPRLDRYLDRLAAIGVPRAAQ